MGKQAAELGFIRDTFEKMSRLIGLLSFFERDPMLSRYLALKGGTAINLIIFNLPRLSVDIDLDFAEMTAITERDIRMRLSPMLRKKERFDLVAAQERVGEYLTELLSLTDSEKLFLSKFRDGEYCPELLFDGNAFERVRDHPMAVWKSSYISSGGKYSSFHNEI